MIGSIVDQRIFEELLDERLPNVAKHLRSINVPVMLISLPWFLCLFATIFDTEVTTHIMDLFLCDPNHSTILFVLALSLLKLQEEKILGLQDLPTISDELKKKIRQ